MRKEDCGIKLPHRKATRDAYMLSTKPGLSFFESFMKANNDGFNLRAIRATSEGQDG